MGTPPIWQPPQSDLDIKLTEGTKPVNKALVPKKVPAFHEIAAGLDPMMPKDEFDQVRKHYFDSYIGPWKAPHEVERARNDFMSKTERPSLLTTGEKIALPAKLLATRFFAAAEESKMFGGVERFIFSGAKGKELVAKNQAKDEANLTQLEKVAAREGSWTAKAGDVGGQFVEGGVELATLGGAAGGVTKLFQGLVEGTKLAELATSTSKAATMAQRLAKGGTTFGVYETLHAQNHLGQAFLRGTAEGFLWEFAPAKTLLGRVGKGAVIGGSIGAAESPSGERRIGALEGALTGGLLNTLNSSEHPKETELKKALTPDLSSPVKPEVNDALAHDSVDSAIKAQREMKPQQITVDPNIRGVKVSGITPDGKTVEFNVTDYGEMRAAADIQKFVLSGGQIVDMAYNDRSQSIFAKLMKAQGELNKPKVDAPVSVKDVVEKPKIKPEEGDQRWVELAKNDDIMRTHGKLPQTSGLYPAFTAARRGVQDALSTVANEILYASNKSGSSTAERTFLKTNLSEVINNRTKGVGRVQGALKNLAYHPELRSLIPPQFRETFDTAALQVEKGASFGTHYFRAAEEYKKLKSLAPLRTEEELTEMSRLLQQVESPQPPYTSTLAMQEWTKARETSYDYPEIGEALDPVKRVVWEASRKEKIDRVTKYNNQQKALAEAKITSKPKTSWTAEDEAKMKVRQEKRNANSVSNEALQMPTSLDEVHDPIAESMREEIESKSRNINVEGASTAEEFRRTGQLNPDQYPQWMQKQMGRKTLKDTAKIPPAETTELKMGENAKIEDGILKVYIPQHLLHEQGAGAMYQPGAIVSTLRELGYKDIPQEIHDYELTSDRLVDPHGNILAGKNSGMLLMPAENPFEYEFHETLHHAVDHVWGKDGFNQAGMYLRGETLTTLQDLSHAYGSLEAYDGQSPRIMHEEGFVHAASALVNEDVEALTSMAIADTSVKRVVDMVLDMASSALYKLRQRPDWMELRYAKKNLETAKAVSSDFVSQSLIDQAEKLHASFHVGPEGDIRFDRANGTTEVFKTPTEAFRWINGEDVTTEAPSFTTSLEQMGVRGEDWQETRFATRGVKRDLTSEPESEHWLARANISNLWRPEGPWIAGLQKKLDVIREGLQSIPLLEKFKAVDDTYRGVVDQQNRYRDVFGQDLKGLRDKMEDAFQILSVEKRFWPSLQSKLKMSPEQMEKVANVHQNLLALDAEHHVGVFNYLMKELPSLRLYGYDAPRVYPALADYYAGRQGITQMSTFAKGIATERFDPKDTHLGRFVDFAIRATEGKVMDKPLRDLKETINLKDVKGEYVLGPARMSLQNYVNYMEGKPDITQRAINKAMGGVQDLLASQFKKINQFLPSKAQLPEKFDYPQAAMNKLISLQYGMALIGRVAVPIRDGLTTLTNGFPVLGPTNFAKGLGRVFSGGFKEARDEGALLHPTNVGELYGDIFNEIPQGGFTKFDQTLQFSNKLMAPSRWGHNAGRATVYLGTKEAAIQGIRDLRAGRITPEKFQGDVGTWFFDKPERSRYLAMAVDGQQEVKEVAQKIALDMVDRTMWAYRRGAQPLSLRTGIGRVFGQYATFPLNQVEYLRTLGSRALEGGSVTKKALAAAGMWVAANTVVLQVGKSAGVDMSKNTFFSSSGYGGGPNLELAMALMRSPEDSDEGRKARKTVLEFPLDFVPGFNFVNQMISTVQDPKAWDDENGPTQEGITRILGFKPLDDKQEGRMDDWDIEQRLKYETGFKPGSTRERDDLEDELLR